MSGTYLTTGAAKVLAPREAQVGDRLPYAGHVDDLTLQTADNIIAAVTTSALTPALQTALDAVSAALTTEDLVQMNKMVDIDRADAATVAQEWLTSKGLVS